VVSFTSRPLYPRRRSTRFPFDMRLVGPKACLDAVAKRKIPTPTRNRIPAVHPVAQSLCRQAFRSYLVSYHTRFDVQSHALFRGSCPFVSVSLYRNHGASSRRRFLKCCRIVQFLGEVLYTWHVTANTCLRKEKRKLLLVCYTVNCLWKEWDMRPKMCSL
jgi:hypothetical protein